MFHGFESYTIRQDTPGVQGFRSVEEVNPAHRMGVVSGYEMGAQLFEGSMPRNEKLDAQNTMLRWSSQV